MLDSLPTTAWTKVMLRECCEEIAQRIDNPAESGFERFVGLEHLETRETSIRNWGSTDDVTSSMKLFKAGDTIVARRNVYLRRAARADFDGVCSGDGIVLRSNPEVCLPDLLPFLLNTEDFWGYVTSQADGTMSKRITVKRLLSYEFALPPLPDQSRIVEVLRAAEGLEERLRSTREALDDLSSSWIESRLASNEWPECIATDVLDRATVGIVVKPAALYVPEGTGVPALRSLNIAPHRILMDNCVNISDQGHREHEKSQLQSGDLAIVRSGRPGDAAVIPEGMGELNCIDLIIATPGKNLRPEFLCAVLNSRFGRRQFASGIAGTAQKHFNVGLFKKLKIPVPQLKVQDAFILQMQQLQSAATSLDLRCAAHGELSRNLLEECIAL